MNTTTIIGLLAGSLTTISFIPQLFRIWKLKETKDISLLMYALFIFGIALWLLYGILLKEIPVIAANCVSLAFAGSILVLKIKYG